MKPTVPPKETKSFSRGNKPFPQEKFFVSFFETRLTSQVTFL